MTDNDKSFVTRLFSLVVAFGFVFIIVAIVGGFIVARLTGIPVDADRFNSVISPAFNMILGAILGFVAGGNSTKKDPAP